MVGFVGIGKNKSKVKAQKSKVKKESAEPWRDSTFAF
jgi:hypothetical protein